MSGPDALDLLHRISTNDVSRVKVGQSVHTILTTEKGKIKDVVSLVRISETVLLLLGTLISRQELAQWIGRFIIMEDVAVEDVTEHYFHYQALWAKPATLFSPEGGTHTLALRDASGTAGSGIVLTDPLAATRAPHLLGEGSLAAAALELLKANAFSEGDERSVHDFYVDQGLPVPGRELTGDVNPHEAGILGLVSFTKGCYIGQEVIARLDTYKKVQKRLMAFALSDGPAILPAPLTSGAEELGHLTSAVRRDDGAWLGLGFVRAAFADNPLPLEYPAHDGSGVAKVRVP